MGSDKRHHHRSPDSVVQINNGQYGQYHHSKIQQMVTRPPDDGDIMSTPEAVTEKDVDTEDDAKQERPDRRVKAAVSPQQMAVHLSRLLKETEYKLVDVTVAHENMAIHTRNYDEDKLDAAQCFPLSDVLPQHLMVEPPPLIEDPEEKDAHFEYFY